MHYFLYLIFPEGAALKLLELVVALELLQVRNIHITHAVHIAHVVHITHAVHIAHVVHVTHVVHPRLKVVEALVGGARDEDEG